MYKKFLITGLVTTLVMFLINTIVFVVFLRDFFLAHPAVSLEFMKQLHRESSQVIPWAVIIGLVSIGFLITTVIKWSGAKTFTSGLKSGFIFAFLFLGSVDFGLYASSNYFSEASLFVDFFVGSVSIGISGAIAAWMLGRGKTN
jgi:hypothetical protein